MENRSVFERLNEFRTSHIGIALFYGYLLAILLVGFLVSRALINLHNVAAQNHRALCSEKHGYETTYNGGKKFLRDHPNGTSDFSKDVIVAAILQAKVQLHAFRDVTCEP